MLAILTDSQEADVQYAPPVTRRGKPAAIQAGSLVWKSSDPAVAVVTGTTEAPIAGVLKASAAGICQVWPEADADLGDGVKTIQGEKIDVQVTGGQATGFGGPTLGTPREQV